MRGIVCATLSAALLAGGFVIGKKVLLDLNTETFVVLWFQSACLFSGFYIWLAKKENLVYNFLQNWRPVVAIGLLNAFSAMTFFSALKLMDPTLSALFNRSEAVYTVLLGLVILKERLNKIEIVGIIVTLVGTVAIVYNSERVVILGLALVLAATFSFSVGSVVAKIAVTDVNYVAFAGLRSFFTALFVLVFSLIFGRLEVPSTSHLAHILFGAFLGPFLGIVFFYYSLTLVDVSKAAVLRSSTPLFVALFSFLFLGMLPRIHQVIGGLIAIIGITLLAVSHKPPQLPQPPC